MAEPSLLWSLLTDADPFSSLFTVAPPPAVVFPLLPSATGCTHHRNSSTGGDWLPCARSWAHPDQVGVRLLRSSPPRPSNLLQVTAGPLHLLQKSFLVCNPLRESHIELRPLGLCSLPLPALPSTTKLCRRHSRRSVCTCVQENGTSGGNKLLPDPRCGNCARCLIAQMRARRFWGETET